MGSMPVRCLLTISVYEQHTDGQLELPFASRVRAILQRTRTWSIAYWPRIGVAIYALCRDQVGLSMFNSQI